MADDKPQKSTSMAKQFRGPYVLEVAQRGEAPLSLVQGIDSKGDIITIGTGKFIEIPKEKKAVHVNEKTLTELDMEGILKKHNFDIISSDAYSMTNAIKSLLGTVSQIYPGFAYDPLQYLTQVLRIELSDAIKEGLAPKFDFDKKAFALALLKTFGFYHVKRNVDIDGNLISGSSDAGVKTEGLETLADSFFSGDKELKEFVSKAPDVVMKLKKDTYKAKSPKEMLEALKDVPLEIGAVLVHDKFGDKSAREFIGNYQRIKMLASLQTETAYYPENFGKINQRVEDALKFLQAYQDSEYFITDFATAKTIAENINNLRLWTSCLHFFEDMLLYDEEGLLQELSRISVENTEEGRKYMLDGKEISFDENGRFYSGRKKVVNALESIRKYGHLKEVGEIRIKADEDKNRVGFDKPFLFARHGFSKAEFSNEEKKYVAQLEELLEKEFEFSYDERPVYIVRDPETKDEVVRIDLPENEVVRFLKIMKFDEASSMVLGGKVDLSEEICSAFNIVYSKMPDTKRLSNDEMNEFMDLENAEGAEDRREELEKRAGIDVLIEKAPYKYLVVKRRLRSNGEHEELGRIEVPSRISKDKLTGKKLSDILDGEVPEEELLRRLQAVKNSGIRYYENGGKSGRRILVFREAHLDEFLESFYERMGDEGEDIEIRAVRVTNTENERYFARLLQMIMEGSGNEKELSDMRASYGISNDDHARMVLEIQRATNREYLDMGLDILAEISGDKKVDAGEEIVYRLLMDTLSQKVPRQAMAFIRQRFERAIKEKEEYSFPEQEELMELLRLNVIERDAPKVSAENPALARMCEIMIDITIPYHIEDESVMNSMLEFNKEFENRYFINMARRVDEASVQGKSKLYDLMRKTTLAEDAVGRINQVSSYLGAVKDAERINKFVTLGASENEFRMMLKAKRKLDEISPALFGRVLERSLKVHTDKESAQVFSEIKGVLTDEEKFRNEFSKSGFEGKFEQYFYKQLSTIISTVRKKYKQEDLGFES